MARGLAALAILVGAAAGARAQEPDAEGEVRTVARIVATGGIGGHLARPVCAEGATLEEAPFARVAPRLVTESGSDDRPFVFDSGGLLTPGGVGRFAAAHTPRELARTLDALGYRALVFGSAELAAPRTPMVRALATIRGRGIPTVATNLHCSARAAALCEVLVDGSDGPSIHLVGEKRLAFFAFLAEDAISRVAPDRAEGVRIGPIEAALRDAVRRARAGGADLIVASVDSGSGPDATARLLALAEALPLEERPDVLFTSGGDESLLFARPIGFRPAIVGTSPTGAVRVRVRESPRSDGYDVLARVMPPSQLTSEPYERFVAALGEAYCAEWGLTLRGGELDRPLGGTDMLDLTAGILREVGDAEVAILNHGVLDARWRPARAEALTASDVYVAIQYDEPLMIADVEGEWLKKLAEKLDATELIALGIERRGNDLLVNGRPLEPRGEYRVVTIRFLSAGGDGALAEGPRWERLGAWTLRGALVNYLERRRAADPRDTLYLPGEVLAWTFRTNVDATFAGSAVYNEAGYEAITQTDSIAVGLDAGLRADALSRWWGLESEGTARYRTTRVPRTDFLETEDRLSGRSTLLYRGLRDRTSRWYVPEPFVEAWLESEFTVPEENTFRHFLIRPTAGLRFSVTQHLKLKLHGGFEYEVLDPNGEVSPGGGAQARLDPYDLIDDARRKLHVELQADYFITTESHTLRFFVDAAIDLAEPLQLVCRFDLIAREVFDRTIVGGVEVDPLGIGASVSAGFRVRWLERLGP